MSVIQDKARVIALAAAPTAPNPTTIITTITTIITNILQMFQSCKAPPAKAASQMRLAASGGVRGWFARRRLWRAINQQPIPAGTSAQAIYDAMLASANDTSTSDVTAMYGELAPSP